MKSLPVLSTAFAFLVAGSAFGAEAAANWENHCATCHGADGKGNTNMGKKLKIRDLTDVSVQDSFTDEAAFNAVKVGVKTPSGKTVMKPIDELNDDEINAMVAYVRGLKK